MSNYILDYVDYWKDDTLSSTVEASSEQEAFEIFCDDHAEEIENGSIDPSEIQISIEGGK